MRKVAKLLQCLFLCGWMCIANPQEARALFGLTPPLPPEPAIDIPDDAMKIISILKAYYRKLQTLETAANSLTLESIKGGALKSMMGSRLNEYIAGKKSPVKDQLEPVPALGIEEKELRETQFYNAFITLFFSAPANGEGVQQARMDYRQKAIEFKQDMIVDAYVAGRLTEDYLVLVEKTIRRLDRCQAGQEKNCTFFGLEWAEVKSTEEAPNNEDNPGQMGEVRNAYIVITVYDRLMRLVEDLAATEAMFQAARSIDLAKPVQGSDASQYINKKFHFAHHQTHETAYASVSENSGKSKQMKNMRLAKILNKLQRIDNWQQGAMAMHNLKVKLPEYKAMYRKYLKTKEVHERALKVLGQCDTCTKTFLKTYDNGLKESWGESSPVNDYINRSGISRELIDNYEKAVERTIIETDNNLCPGYYYKGNCPAGYKAGETCKIVKMVEVPDKATGNMNVEEEIIEMPDYHECLADSAQKDSADAEEVEEMDENDRDDLADKLNEDDTDYLVDDSTAEEMNKDARIKSERAWRIGEQKIMDLTISHQLKFEPWNDQMSLQEMYLRQKYHNLKLIVLSVDDAVNTFKFAKEYVEKHPGDVQADLQKDPDYIKAKEFVKAATRCKAATDVQVTDAPINGWCGGGCDGHCRVVSSNDAAGTVVTERRKTTIENKYDEDGNLISSTPVCKKTETTTWIQEVNLDGSNCAVIQAPKELQKGPTSGCPGEWDLSAEFLVTNYFKAVEKLGKCAEDTKTAAENMRKTAKDIYKRRVAQDLLRSIIQLREDQDEKMREFVKDYDTQLTTNRNKLTQLRVELGEINVEIDEATKLKNAAVKERKRADLRVEAISNELKNLRSQLELNKGQETIDSTSGDSKQDFMQQCSIEVQIRKLEYEAHAICDGADVSNHKACAEFREEPEDWGSLEGLEGCLAVRDEKKDFDEDVKTLNSLSKDKFIVNFEMDLKTTMHVLLTECDSIIRAQDAKLAILEARRDQKKEEITILETQIKEAAKAFAEMYITLAVEHQKKLDEKNATFESYLESLDKAGENGKRMQRDTRKVCHREPPFIGNKVCEETGEVFDKDNLESTLKNILYRGKSTLTGKDQIIWQGFEETWHINDITKVLAAIKALGVHDEFLAGPSMEGVNTALLLAEKVRDLMATAATRVLDKYITEIDENVAKEREKAKELIQQRAEALGVFEDQTPDEDQLKFLSDHANYAEDGDITLKHEELLENLRQPKYLHKYGVTDLSDFFGIPDKNELYKIPECSHKGDAGEDKGECFFDDKYFVGLPARGNNYIDKVATDENAGRDFRAPKEPLLNLPPLREVFYFSAADYDDMPKNSFGVPSWTTFLNKKYVQGGWNDFPFGTKEDGSQYKPQVDENDVGKWDYLPVTWLHLLARPNMRNDGLYQQTFEERPFGDGAIQQILDKSASDAEYRVIIARSGVYPCMLGGTIIDVKARNDNPGNITFGLGSNPGLSLSQCQEIASNADRSTPCGIYNKGKGGLCHLLADHARKHDDGEPIEDSQRFLTSSIKSQLYTTHSELGNLFKVGKATILNPLGNKIIYRPMQQGIHDYLMDEDNSENNINYQKTSRAAFTHNIFSSFLEAVDAEHSALKNLENTKENLNLAMLNLCQQIHAQGYVVGDYGEGFDEELLKDPKKCDNACQEKFHNKCVELILEGAGLATSADDDKTYGVADEYNSMEYAEFNGISCSEGNSGGSFYEELFCKLDQWKDELIEKSHKGDGAHTIINERGEEETDTWVGIDNIGEAATEAERDQYFEPSTDTSDVAERWQIILNYDAALKADPNETVFLTPTISTFDKEQEAEDFVKNELNPAQKDRTTARESDEDAIKAIGNQSQVVPYCPLYINNRKAGL